MMTDSNLVRRKPSAGFPIVALPEAVEIVREAAKFGTTHSRSAFAQYMGHTTTNSGAFKGRLAAFRDWGFVSTGGDQVALTELGKRVALPPDPAREIDDLRAAFLSASAFADIYDSCAKGQPLDLGTIANNAVHRVGIAPASKERFAASFARSVVAASLGREVNGGRLILGEMDRSAEAPVVEDPRPLQPVTALAPTTTGTQATVSLPWSIPGGRVLLEISFPSSLPPAAFASLSAVTGAIEELVAVLRSSERPLEAEVKL